MQDRVPLYPGRVTLTPVSGQANTYDLTRADQPTQEGTPLNKASLLKDATAALFGLGTDAVPDDVIAYLGKYAEYWWKRYAVTPATYTLTPPPSTSSSYWLFIYRYNSIEWATEVSVSSDGVVSLVNPTTATADDLRTNPTSWRGRFVKGVFKIGSTTASNQNLIIHFTSQLSSASLNNSYVTFNATEYETVSGVPATVSDAFDYVRSSNRNAYPDDDIQGGYKYSYIGVPLDNAVTAPKIATGSYTGTGTYGASHPNSLTFEFEPKLVIIQASQGYGYQMLVFIYKTGEELLMPWQSTSGSFTNKGKINNNVVSWYMEGNSSAIYQLNELNTKYYYIAIG